MNTSSNPSKCFTQGANVSQVAEQIHPSPTKEEVDSLRELLEAKSAALAALHGGLASNNLHFGWDGESREIAAYKILKQPNPSIDDRRNDADRWDGSFKGIAKFEKLSRSYFAANPSSDCAFVLVGNPEVLMSTLSKNGNVQTVVTPIETYHKALCGKHVEVESLDGGTKKIASSDYFRYPKTIDQFEVAYDPQSRSFGEVPHNYESSSQSAANSSFRAREAVTQNRA